MTKYEINTIFLDFDMMIKSKSYLYNKLASLFEENNISFEFFSLMYDEASLSSKP